MKRTVAIFLSLVVSAIILIVPYKGYTTLIFNSTVTTAIYQDIVAIFKYGIWVNMAFVFVLLPPVLLLQIRRSPFTVYKLALFLLEGIIALFAALFMYFFMTFTIFEENVVLKPTFYLSLSWVLVGAIGSIVLAKKTIYDKAVKLLYN